MNLDFDGDVPALGHWWIAGDRDTTLPGVLGRESTYYRLVLDGNLRGSLTKQPDRRFTIHGVSLGKAYTLFDAVVVGGRGGPRRYMIDPPDEFPATAQQDWATSTIVVGGHLDPSERFKECRALNSGAEHVWHRRVLTTEEFADDSPIEKCSVAKNEEFEVRLIRRPTISMGRLDIAASSQLKFDVAAVEGMTLWEIDRRILYPLNLLVGVLENRATRMWGQQLFRTPWDEGDPSRSPAELQVNPDVKHPRVEFVIPLLSADDGALFEEVASQWLMNAPRLSSVMGVVAPHPHVEGYIQSEVFQTVGAVEALDREIRPTDEEPGENLQRILAALGSFLREKHDTLGLNSRARARLMNFVRNGARPTLQQRLERVGQDLGDLGDWLLNGQIDDWALVASSIRNEIGHGLHRYRWAYDDWDLLKRVRETAEAIARSRLLTLCGMPLPLVNKRCMSDWYYRAVHDNAIDWHEYAIRLDPT